MNRIPPHMRGMGRDFGTPRQDNEQAPSYASQQSFVTWGDRQTITFDPPAGFVGPGTLFALFPVAAFTIPGLVAFNQLVDLRFKRPTTFAVCLFLEMTQSPIGDYSRILFNINTSVGKAANRIQRVVQYDATLATSGTAPAIVSTLDTSQIAAHTIQIIPEGLATHYSTAGPQPSRTISWSAWVAPLVD